jgi:hypothetical protein
MVLGIHVLVVLSNFVSTHCTVTISETGVGVGIGGTAGGIAGLAFTPRIETATSRLPFGSGLIRAPSWRGLSLNNCQ